MSPDLDRRIGAALHKIVDMVPPDAVAPQMTAEAPTEVRRRSRLLPVGVFAAVVLILLAVAVLPGAPTGPDRGPAGGPGPAAVLPVRFAGMSLLTAAVSDSPPGPAIALYKQGALGTRYLGTRQVVVVGADGRTYRRVDAAEDRGVFGADGEWEPADALLAPDGGSAVLTQPELVTSSVGVVDLRTGKVRGYRLDRPAAAYSIAWSPDGRRVALMLGDAPIDRSAGAGRLAILDITTGAVTALTMSRSPNWSLTTAFSPDGNRLAVTVDIGLAPGDPPTDIGPVPQGTDRAAVIVDLANDPAGTVVRTIPLPKWHSLAGPAAWSPDGALLVAARYFEDASSLTFLDATGEDRSVPPPRPLRGPLSDLLGWRSPALMLIGTGNGRDYRIDETPVRGGEPRTVSRLPQGAGQLARIGRVQLAAALIGTAAVTDAGDTDRGPWPRWWRITLTALILLAVWLLRRRIRDGWTAWRRSG
jgi:hypothetical protein